MSSIYKVLNTNHAISLVEVDKLTIKMNSDQFNNIFYLRSFVTRRKVLQVVDKIVYSIELNQTSIYSYFGKLYMIGLGYKNFILNGLLYILVGNCNYIIFSIPNTVKIYCKKHQIYFLGQNSYDVFNFMANIKKVKKLNLYKGKGVIQFKNFKFTKLKIGKKQRFM